MSIRAIILSSFLLLAAPLFARDKTDLMVMKNGDRMTCEIKGLDGGVLYVSFDYIDGTASVDWSKVAHLESKQLFIVKTQDGSMYTGTLDTPETAAGRPAKIQVVETPENEVVIDRPQVVQMVQTSENFWQRFNGEISSGFIYSKGNQSTQFNLGSETEYVRERWNAKANFSSTLASSTGTNASTRNALGLSALRLLPWNNWFYSGLGTFLQSSEQGINLQTTVGGGIGRYLKNTNRASISLLGGVAWQQTNYKPSIVPLGATKRCLCPDRCRCQALQVQQDESERNRHCPPSPFSAGPRPNRCQCVLLRQAHQQPVVECFVLRQLGQPASARLFRERLRDQLGAKLDLWH